MNLVVKIGVIDSKMDLSWGFMYLNSTTTKGTKKLFMLTPHKTPNGVKILPRMDTQVQPRAPSCIEDLSVVLS